MCKIHNITNGQIEISYDGESALGSVFVQRYIDSKTIHQDIITAARNIIQKLYLIFILKIYLCLTRILPFERLFGLLLH